MAEINEEMQTAVEKAVKKAVLEILEEQKKSEKQKMLYNTKKLMESYNEMKKYIQNAVSEEKEMEDDAYLLFKGENAFLQSVRRSKMVTALMILNIDRAITELEAEHEKNGTLYKVKAFKMYYIDRIAFEQIAERLNSGKNSPSTWTKLILKQMSVKLFGIYGIGNF